jgi:hypothetical protein
MTSAPSEEPPPGEGEPPEQRHVLESGVRLSESMLWGLQRRFFSESGTSAWATGGVPWWITTNASMGLAYARVVSAYLQDCLEDGLLAGSDPLYVVELGAGHARLTRFVFLRLRELMESAGTPPDRLCYVFTDVAERNLEFFASHPLFRPYIEAGAMDCALFDAENPGELRLRHSGITLGESSEPRPLVVIANYIIDSIRMDVFRVQNGELHEGLLTLSSPQEEPDPTDPSTLERLVARYEYEYVGNDRYEDPVLVEILRGYAERLGDTWIPFPTAAFGALRELERISGGHMLVLAADKGFASEQELGFSAEPRPVTHGNSFSLSVNFHALGLWTQQHGGVALHTAPRDTSLRISAFALGLGAHRSVLPAFAHHIDRFGPLDVYAVQEEFVRGESTPSLAALLALVRMSDYDPRLFLYLADRITALCSDVSSTFRFGIRQTVFEVWERFLPWPGASDDLPFALGGVLAALKFLDDALRFYGLSVEHFGEHYATRYNMALYSHQLRDLESAEQYLIQSLELEPGFGPARSLRLRLEEELRRPLAKQPEPSSVPGPGPGVAGS